MTAEMLAILRFLIIYPILLVFGIVWGIMFLRRWRVGRCFGDGWASVLGFSLAAWGGMGLSALYIAQVLQEGTYTILTGAMFTIGALIVCGVVIAGAVALFGVGWRNGRR